MAAYGTSDDYDPVSRLQSAFVELQEVCETLLEVTQDLAESQRECHGPADCPCWYHHRIQKIRSATRKLQNVRL